MKNLDARLSRIEVRTEDRTCPACHGNPGPQVCAHAKGERPESRTCERCGAAGVPALEVIHPSTGSAS